MDIVFSTRAEATPQAIAPLRHAMVAAFETAGGDPSDSDDVALAVTEACANAVRHAYPTDGDARMTVDTWIEDELFVVQIRDHGRLLDAETHEAREGLGVRLMQEVAETDIMPRPAAAPKSDSLYRSLGRRVTRFAGRQGARSAYDWALRMATIASSHSSKYANSAWWNVGPVATRRYCKRPSQPRPTRTTSYTTMPDLFHPTGGGKPPDRDARPVGVRDQCRGLGFRLATTSAPLRKVCTPRCHRLSCTRAARSRARE
jgi:anti-sigma regulatory factor (Ser/Thr protein kinase)